MASSSSSASSSQSPRKYDVFISFRGEDTRCNFTSHLHDALCRNKIETYIDYRLEKGDEVWPALVKAIEDSALFLIVFSENYASSTWCLNELTKILECSKDHEEHLVIPVFYKIDPSHVRKQKGNYEIAFSKHEHTNHNQQIQKWKDALTQAANLCGWHSNTYRNEAELVEEIVKGLLLKLDRIHQSVYLDGLIGIHQQIAHVESLLCNESQDVRFIGIWGMGGIGKTTLAMAIFNKLCFKFESFCFLANVREESDKYGMSHLKNKLISKLLGGNEPYMSMLDGESAYARKRLSQKRVFVVLDDVNDPEQVKNLVGACHWFGQGSRIIITTRDKQVLGKNVCEVYEVNALWSDQALQLFNLNAFRSNCPDKEFERLSWMFVDYAKGIPLALIVLGSFLYGKDKKEWKNQLEKLEKMPFTKIQQILKLSYDGLDHEEKNIFLDVACFFKGTGIEDIKILLDSYGYSTTIGLKSLQDKALVTISYGEVSMHDLVQEMGLEIVREESLEDPEKRSRLWNVNDIYQVLKDNKGNEAIKGITLDMSKIEELQLNPLVFAKMHKLKFLEFYNSNSKRQRLHLPQGLEFLSNELRYLRWDNYPSKSLPLIFSAEKLVKLDMQHSCLRKLWDGVQNVGNLKVINLYDSKHLIKLPDFSRALRLEEVNLSKCASLRKVHQSILSLHKLQVLLLDYCVVLRSLKTDIHLRSLRHLSLRHCLGLTKFSVSSENMQHLDLQGTAIHKLPSSMGCQFRLKMLNLSGCERLKNLPRNLFDGLKSLQELWLNDCCNLFEIPDNINMLSSLSQLSIEGSAVESLPASIKHLSCLKCFCFNNCRRLRCLPELPPSIRALNVLGCPSLETLQFPSKSNTNYIYLRNCMKLDEHLVKAILANVLLRINRSIPELQNYCKVPCKDLGTKAEVIYPGSRVPEWFKYRTTHATSITIDLSSAPLSTDWGFIFSISCSPSQRIRCASYLRITNDQSGDEGYDDDDNDKSNVFHEMDATDLTSDHVCLWYNAVFCFKLHQKIKARKATYNSEILFEVKILVWDNDKGKWKRHCKGIKEFGVCPTYTSEYQNFIKAMEPESQANESRMEFRASTMELESQANESRMEFRASTMELESQANASGMKHMASKMRKKDSLRSRISRILCFQPERKEYRD